jgi:hypothetical protein
MRSTVPLALWATCAGHALVLLAAVTDSLDPNMGIAAAVACSILAVAALSELAPAHVRGERAVAALAIGHGVAALIMVAGIAPSVPRSIPLAGFAAGAALGAACLATVARAATGNRPPRPLTLAPRVAAIALVIPAAVQRWAASEIDLAMPLRAAIFVAIAGLAVALLASLSIIALRLRTRWELAALLAWTVGWVVNAADLSSLILWSLGRAFYMDAHPQLQLVQIVVTVGGLTIGAALVTAIRDVRSRHSAVVLLVAYAVFGLMAAVADHRIELATDFPHVAALRKDRDLADALGAVAFAAVLWQSWRLGRRRSAD